MTAGLDIPDDLICLAAKRGLLDERAARVALPGFTTVQRLLDLARAAEAAADFEEALRLNPALAPEITPLLDRARRAAGEEW